MSIQPLNFNSSDILLRNYYRSKFMFSLLSYEEKHLKLSGTPFLQLTLKFREFCGFVQGGQKSSGYGKISALTFVKQTFV